MTPPPPAATVRVETSPRRVRGRFAGEVVFDTFRALLLFETGHLPRYYIPLEDVRSELLEPSTKRSHCPRKGEASWYTLRVGERSAADAAWRYAQPLPGCPDISRHVCFYCDALDSWWEEDDEIFVHPRDPYVRVDVLRSSRHVRVTLGSAVLAESRRPLLLFETGLPTRYYLPRADVRLELLTASPTRTSCPYKGNAVHFSAQVDGQLHADVAWSYPTPFPELAKIEQAICFYPDRLELEVDGVRQ